MVIFVQVVTLAGQIIIVFFGGEAFQTVRLSGAEWGWSILFGLLTLPVGVVIRLIPDSLVHKLSVALEYCLHIKSSRRPVGDHEHEAAQHRRSISQSFKTMLPRIFVLRASPRDAPGHDSTAIGA